MFPFFENLGFWAVSAVLCVLVFLVTRRHVHKQRLTAPKESLRSTSQQALYWVSFFLHITPLGYVVLINGELFWAAFAILWAEAGSMFLLRLLRVRYTIRVWLLVPISVISVIVGASVAVWPSVDLSSLLGAPWFFLVFAAFFLALGSAFSLYSFPVGYGERSH